MRPRFLADFATGAQIVLSATAIVLCIVAVGDCLITHPSFSTCWITPGAQSLHEVRVP